MLTGLPGAAFRFRGGGVVPLALGLRRRLLTHRYASRESMVPVRGFARFPRGSGEYPQGGGTNGTGPVERDAPAQTPERSPAVGVRPALTVQ
ncbi:hypothetical protein GCM10010145_19910 [Streptomyces ruber]|uniref:Uncharacterized protein n=2 Tax=Streptomyces TaxID=1883 RepID=A0A918BA66_9ACTN|nr:hypothetical protein GCM10010145_19910 [Streptomyces ruber]